MLVAVVGAFGVAAALAGATSSTVNKAQNSSLGPIVVAPNGLTLYADAAEHNDVLKCLAACVLTWRPLLISGTAKPVAGPGVNSRLLGTVKRGTKLQVTLNKHPLYTYVGDTKKGQANGQDANGVWHVVTPAGVIVLKSASTSAGAGTGSSSTSGSGSSNSSGSGSNTGSGSSNTGGGGTSTTPSDCTTNPGGYGCM